MGQKRKFSLIRDVMGGELFTRDTAVKYIPFIVYIVFLLLVYMTINQAIINGNRTINRNNLELKHLKANYTSKAATLQNQSSRNIIIERLRENGSTLKNPTTPAQNLKIGNDGKN